MCYVPYECNNVTFANYIHKYVSHSINHARTWRPRELKCGKDVFFICFCFVYLNVNMILVVCLEGMNLEERQF